MIHICSSIARYAILCYLGCTSFDQPAVIGCELQELHFWLDIIVHPMIVSNNKDYQFNDCNQDVGGSQNVQTLQVSAD